MNACSRMGRLARSCLVADSKTEKTATAAAAAAGTKAQTKVKDDSSKPAATATATATATTAPTAAAAAAGAAPTAKAPDAAAAAPAVPTFDSPCELVLPPVFNRCTVILGTAQERKARDLYWQVVTTQTTPQHRQAAAENLKGAVRARRRRHIVPHDTHTLV